MAAEELLVLIGFLLAVVTIVGAGVVYKIGPGGQRRARLKWVPTYENLRRYCPACEHLLMDHSESKWCRGAPRAGIADMFPPLLDKGGACECKLTPREAYPVSLSLYELQARKELGE